MKRFIAILLTLILTFAFAVTAFAEETGSITIKGIHEGMTYAVYQLLDLESYDKDSNAYSYTVNPAWDGFFAGDEAKAYVTIDGDGYVEWIADDSDTVMAAFAQEALAYAGAHSIAPNQSSENEGQMTVSGNQGVFANLDLGWYLVDSSAGVLCGLTTTDPDAEVNEKSLIPTIDKEVQEDLDDSFGATNIADIGEVVNFKTTIDVAEGAQNYVVHDIMSDAFTFVQDLDNNRGVTEVKKVDQDGNQDLLALGTDYTVEVAPDEDCTFEIVFADSYMDELAGTDQIEIYYNALLNQNAKVGAQNGNPNETYLAYGDNHKTTSAITYTYTFSFDIVKTDDADQLLDGAQFRIYDAATLGNEIKVVAMEKDGVTVYRPAMSGEEGVAINVAGGKATVIGLDNGTYYLEETVAPTGYNKLTARKSFQINDASLDAVFDDGVYDVETGVQVVNKTGSVLPDTGATGTIVFIVIGVLVVLGTGVLLVTKKRMAMIQD